MSREERPEPRGDRDRDLASWLAVDMPHAGAFAVGLNATAPELARALLTAQKNKLGWRLRLPWNDGHVMALRSLALVEVAGFEPTENQLRQGRGTYLGDFGERVLLNLRALRASK